MLSSLCKSFNLPNEAPTQLGWKNSQLVHKSAISHLTFLGAKKRAKRVSLYNEDDLNPSQIGYLQYLFVCFLVVSWCQLLHYALCLERIFISTTTSRSLKFSFGSRLGLYHLESHHAKFQSISMKTGRVINILEFLWVWVGCGFLCVI